MGNKLETPNSFGGTTDHSTEVTALRRRAASAWMPDDLKVDTLLAADLLEAHDQTGISLDRWSSARSFVERFIEDTIVENGV